MTHLVQIRRGKERRVALVEEPQLRLLTPEVSSVYALALEAIAKRKKLADLAKEKMTKEALDYDPIYAGNSDWKLLPPLDHPDEPARCLVSGTGLTHLGSAKNRHAMHEKEKGPSPTDAKALVGEQATPLQKNGTQQAAPLQKTDAPLTDSMKMFQWGVEGGKPGAGKIGVAPEWFYKGNGAILRAHNEPLSVPSYAEDGGEEGEVAGCYVIGPDGRPYRVGFVIGNEFSDHVFEKKNYLNLAGSKIRTCAIGPELVVDAAFQSIPGAVMLERDGQPIWTKKIRTGEAEMCHSLENIEHHHFKFETHRRPGDVHIHYFGADSLSFGDGVRLANGDLMRVRFENFGRPLRNPLQVAKNSPSLVAIQPL